MKPFPNNRLTPDEILDATYAAADAILEVYHQREEIVAQTKKDNSPVTEADLRAHHILNDVLLRSGWPVMSEEGQHAAFADRRDWEYYWVVDPLDGTKEFIKGNGEFTINIALVQGQTPIFGVVYSPVLNWLFVGGPEMGAYKSMQRVSWSELLAQGMRLPGRLPEKTTVVASRSHGSPATEALIAHWEAQHGQFVKNLPGGGRAGTRVSTGRPDHGMGYRRGPCGGLGRGLLHVPDRGDRRNAHVVQTPCLQQGKPLKSLLLGLRCAVSLRPCVT